MYSVYVHINKFNKKLYFGITKQEPTRRWLNGYGYRNSPHFLSAINLYGWDNFEHIILGEGLEESEAKYFEKELIRIYKTQDNNFGYNIDEGGDSNSRSEETKQKISDTETGKFVSEETKKKLSEAMTGYVWPREVVERRRATYKSNEHHLTEEHKEAIRQAQLGNKNGCHPCAEETKDKISFKLKGNNNGGHPVICDETSEEYASKKICSKAIGVSVFVLNKAIKNNTPINGLHYKLKD